MAYKIALVPGDGIGPEIVDSAVQVLEKIGTMFGHQFEFTSYLAGGCAIDETGIPLPQETLEGCLASDSVLLGAVGGPKWDTLPGNIRPEKALLGLRSELGLYTNLRPAKIQPALAGACVLREDIAKRGFDILIVRELTGGIYFGERGRRDSEGGEEAYDTERYNVAEVERVARVAFESARKRSGKVTSIDKANVLETSRLWRETVHRLAEEYPDVELNDMLVDNAAMQLIRQPREFDVVVTENMFGDILSDEAAQIAGSLGMLASASLGDGVALYEPTHGSAPDIAGRGIANPLAQILSVELMLRYSFHLDDAADAIHRAVVSVLDAGWRTGDIAGDNTSNDFIVGTTRMGDLVIERLEHNASIGA